MFKAVITEKDIKINGTILDKLAGLAYYAETLKKSGIPKSLIYKAINIGLKDEEAKGKVETILDIDVLKIKKYDLSNMTKEEAKNFIVEEILEIKE